MDGRLNAFSPDERAIPAWPDLMQDSNINAS